MDDKPTSTPSLTRRTQQMDQFKLNSIFLLGETACILTADNLDGLSLSPQVAKSSCSHWARPLAAVDFSNPLLRQQLEREVTA